MKWVKIHKSRLIYTSRFDIETTSNPRRTLRWVSLSFPLTVASAVLSGLVLSNSVLATKLLNIKSVDLGKFSVKDGAMLSVNIYVAMMIKSALIKQGLLPPTINIPTS